MNKPVNDMSKAKNANDMSKSANDMSKSANDMSKNANDMSKNANDMSKSVDGMSKSADGMSKSAAKRSGCDPRYIVGLRASDVSQLVRDAVRLGVMQAVKAYEPGADWVRTKDLREWLSIVGADYKVFQRLEKAGFVKRKRLGERENSPIVYSKADVMQAFLSGELCTKIFAIDRAEICADF